MKHGRLSVTGSALLAALFLTILTWSGAAGQTKIEKIDALMKLYNEYGQFNGSVLVAEQGRVIYKKGFGAADMEWDIPNEPDTKFRLGSITKQFTSMLVLQLVNEGKLRLEGRVTDYLPDYPKSTGDRITIHHLLTHSSGIPNYTNFPSFFPTMSRDPYTPQAFIRVFADSALQFEPGSKFSYCNSGYFLLGAIIEKVTGRSYEQVLTEKILEPLGMKNTGFDHHETILKKRARAYEKRSGSYQNAAYLDMSLPYAAGSLYSTVEDLYLWDQALYTDALLPAGLKELLFKHYIRDEGGWYGYGWAMRRTPLGSSPDSVNTIGHGGGINGFNTLITRVPPEKELVVLLNNTGGARLGAMNRAILGILHDKPYDLPKGSVAEAVLAVMNSRGVEAGIARFHELLDKHADKFAVNEDEMNVAGYTLLQGGKLKEAVAMFRLNVETYPASWNVYDSLGEALMADGQKGLAAESYHKSLELNPANTGGREMLKKLEAK
jgi:CubicO group peptidase (beta-lactamase class C family)